MRPPVPVSVKCAFCGGRATGRFLPASRTAPPPAMHVGEGHLRIGGYVPADWGGLSAEIGMNVYAVCDDCAKLACDPSAEPPPPTY